MQDMQNAKGACKQLIDSMKLLAASISVRSQVTVHDELINACQSDYPQLGFISSAIWALHCRTLEGGHLENKWRLDGHADK
jgi:hypothetical protein